MPSFSRRRMAGPGNPGGSAIGNEQDFTVFRVHFFPAGLILFHGPVLGGQALVVVGAEWDRCWELITLGSRSPLVPVVAQVLGQLPLGNLMPLNGLHHPDRSCRRPGP